MQQVSVLLHGLLICRPLAGGICRVKQRSDFFDEFTVGKQRANSAKESVIAVGQLVSAGHGHIGLTVDGEDRSCQPAGSPLQQPTGGVFGHPFGYRPGLAAKSPEVRRLIGQPGHEFAQACRIRFKLGCQFLEITVAREPQLGGERGRITMVAAECFGREKPAEEFVREREPALLDPGDGAGKNVIENPD